MSCTTLPYPGLLHLRVYYWMYIPPYRRGQYKNMAFNSYYLSEILRRKRSFGRGFLHFARPLLSWKKNFLLRLALPISRSLSLSRQLAVATEPRTTTATSFLHPSRPRHLLPHFAQHASLASSPSQRRRDASSLRASTAAPTNINGG
jgi:hypothetical protein